MATNAVVTETTRIHYRSHISKLNEFATESNVQALQHNYRNNIIPYFWLISPRTHNPYFKHTCHTHKHTPAVHSGTVRTDRRTPCHTLMTDKNSDLLDRTFPLRPGKKGGGYLLWAEKRSRTPGVLITLAGKWRYHQPSVACRLTTSPRRQGPLPGRNSKSTNSTA